MRQPQLQVSPKNENEKTILTDRSNLNLTDVSHPPYCLSLVNIILALRKGVMSF